ncbi:unnamed protein product [Ectocarpus sp. 4 AP-2014]
MKKHEETRPTISSQAKSFTRAQTNNHSHSHKQMLTTTKRYKKKTFSSHYLVFSPAPTKHDTPFVPCYPKPTTREDPRSTPSTTTHGNRARAGARGGASPSGGVYVTSGVCRPLSLMYFLARAKTSKARTGGYTRRQYHHFTIFLTVISNLITAYTKNNGRVSWSKNEPLSLSALIFLFHSFSPPASPPRRQVGRQQRQADSLLQRQETKVGDDRIGGLRPLEPYKIQATTTKDFHGNGRGKIHWGPTLSYNLLCRNKGDQERGSPKRARHAQGAYNTTKISPHINRSEALHWTTTRGPREQAAYHTHCVDSHMPTTENHAENPQHCAHAHEAGGAGWRCQPPFMVLIDNRKHRLTRLNYDRVLSRDTTKTGNKAERTTTTTMTTTTMLTKTNTVGKNPKLPYREKRVYQGQADSRGKKMDWGKKGTIKGTGGTMSPYLSNNHTLDEIRDTICNSSSARRNSQHTRDSPAVLYIRRTDEEEPEKKPVSYFYLFQAPPSPPTNRSQRNSPLNGRQGTDEGKASNISPSGGD